MTLQISNLNSVRTQILDINKYKSALFHTKRDIISRLEEEKRKLRRNSTKKTGKSNFPAVLVNEKLQTLLDRSSNMTSSKLGQPQPQGDIDQLMLEIRASLGRNLSPPTLADADISIPADISHIQNIHDVIVQDLDELKRTMERYINIVDKTELITNILNYKQYELAYSFRTEFDKLKERKDALTAKEVSLDEQGKVALEIVEIDDQLQYMTEDHQRELDSIKAQKIDAQKEYENAIAIIDQQFEKMCRGFQKLLLIIEAEKQAVSATQIELIEEQNASKIESYKADIDKYEELQASGWKVLYPEEKISESLQERGLKVSVTGVLLTEEGNAITLEEAQEKKMLLGLEQATINTIRNSMSPSSATKENKGKRGSKNKNGDNSSSKSGSSLSSKMSSEDVCYLKSCLGKPLTLALAEITAVQPRDPIHYLGHWLFKFRYNQQMEDVNDMEFEALNEMRVKLAQERWHKFIEEEARACVIDMIIAAEEMAMMNELRRIQKEAEAMEEEENMDDEARDVLGTYNGPPTGQVPL